ncbi:hypothetical protein AKG30_00600 [Lacticaseibacillus paracasei]|uniref:hypothetical protein n=1 Tax=Lacticaseibacillus paracasei TaxID=1597 RepID=UPI00067FD79C|nr:hypothetical protein [Lacticaseibacillus paracasei]AKU33585.1 hypothetical protein AKG30_00600 [Lacticaseibacillus paracasei]
MDAILMSLMTALNEHLLINVYQRDTDDFYTGYVQVLGHDAVVLGTYNDSGIADGCALIAFSAIDQVEFAGDDLDSMNFRINLAQAQHFLTLQGQEKPLQFDATQNLIQQLATQAKANGQMVMVVVADDDAYLEGQVTAVAEDRFSMAIFNKFNYTDVRALQVDFSDILVMEFYGLDLKLETELVRQRDHLKHVATKLYQNDGQLAGVFQNALANNRLISVVPKGPEDQFFVGRVKAVNDRVVVLSLKDMAGQFGGYILLTLPSIQNVATASDYLQTISFYEKWDQTHHFSQQPVLNADREFDPNDDLIQTIISEAAGFERVVRIKVADSDEHFLGYPENVGETDFDLNLVGPDDGEMAQIRYGQIREIAFGHIFAYLQEAQLKNAGR